MTSPASDRRGVARFHVIPRGCYYRLPEHEPPDAERLQGVGQVVSAYGVRDSATVAAPHLEAGRPRVDYGYGFCWSLCPGGTIELQAKATGAVSIPDHVADRRAGPDLLGLEAGPSSYP